MDVKKILPILQEEFRDFLARTRSSTPRDYVFPEAKGLVKVAVGMRRSGKTYFLFQTMRDLIKKGVDESKILYLNFEDDRLLPLDAAKMGEMVDALYTLYPHLHETTTYLFLDEVQNVEGWPLVIRRLLDSKDIEIYITGSSAKLLSKEIATSLRGRSIALEIQPYNFKEYLECRSLSLPTPPFGKRVLDQSQSHLVGYFERGGFPGVQGLEFHERIETLQNYVEVVVLRDIVERHKVSNVNLLKYFVSTLIKNSSSRFSVNKFHKDVTSQGYKVGKDTLYHYLGYLEDAFLLFTVPIFTESLRVLETTPKKIYSIDTGLINANSFNLSLNFGKMFENLIYMELRRQKREVYYYSTQEGYEIDFVTKDLQGNFELIQVVWDKEDARTLEREERALAAAKAELNFPGRLIDWQTYIAQKGAI